MTVIGKILTFLVFFLSIVFLGFAYNINQLNKDPKTGKSWYDVAQINYNAAMDARKDVNAKAEEVKAKLAAATADRDQALTAQKNAVQETEKARKDREEAITAAQKAKTDFETSQIALKAATDELAQRRQEANALTQTLKQKELAINALTQEKIVSDHEMTKAQVAAGTYLARLQSVERQLQDTTRELEVALDNKATMVSKGAEGAGIEGPAPPDDVKGTVVSVTPDGLVAISIGSDAGLLKGHTLQVFRREPKPLYLGTIKLVEVGPHEAVGKITAPPQYRKLIQTKDEVVSRIVPR